MPALSVFGISILWAVWGLRAADAQTQGQSQKPDRQAIIISAGPTAGTNLYRFYQNAKDMYQGLRAAGFSRDQVTTLYADGTGKENTAKKEKYSRFFGLSTVEDYFIHSVNESFEGDQKSDLKLPANESGIKSAIDRLSKLKSGDRAFLFLTGTAASNLGLCLWNGQYCSPDDLEKELSKVPSGVMVRIAVDASYGGRFLKLTRPGVCVVTNSDENHPIATNELDDPFVKGMAQALKNTKKQNGQGANLNDLLEAGEKSDLPQNTRHQSSLDYFLSRQVLESKASSEKTAKCMAESGPLASIGAELKDIDLCIAKNRELQKDAAQKELHQKLQGMLAALSSSEVKAMISAREKIAQELKALSSRWQGLSGQEKEKLRPTLTAEAERLKREDLKQQQRVRAIVGSQDRVLAELRFLKSAKPNQLKEYLNIKRCLQDEI